MLIFIVGRIRMKKHQIAVSMITLLLIASCSGGSSGGSGAMINFVATQDGAPLEIKADLFDTPTAKEFMTTGKNTYIGQADAIAAGKKLFQMYSCTQCHGGDAGGQTGPSLHGPNFNYAKNATNKGMFETVWHGTNGGMGAKGKGLMDPTDPSNGLTPDELLKIQAWIRSHNESLTGNE